MERIKIIEAVSLCNASIGKPIKEIEESLRHCLWPDSSVTAMKQNLYHLKIGKRTTLSLEQVQIICQVTGCDANFLFEID